MALPGGAGVPAALADKLASLEPKKGRGPGPLDLQDPDLGSLRPYELSETLRPAVERLGLQQNLADMEATGYTVVRDCFGAEECDELVAAVHRAGPGNHMLGKGGEEAFHAVVVHEKLITMAEYMVGMGCQLSQLAASVQKPSKRHRGAPKAGLHADQNWTPAPFPEHNQLFTCCVVLSDDYTLENGATCVVPGSHKLRRHPNRVEQQHCSELVEPILARRGDAACWDGSVWHAPGVRQAPGVRVVLHVTYSRISLTPLECYDDVPEETIAAKPFADKLRRIIGRGQEMAGLFNLRGSGRDMSQFMRLTEMARGTYDRAAFDGRVQGARKTMAMLQAAAKDPRLREALESFSGPGASRSKL